jgi:acarbose 7IV-phosphotransferase
MSRILVSGLINIETTLAVDGFPVEYQPVRYPFFGVRTTVSGVGYNVAKALKTLGNDVRFLSMIGRDGAGHLVHDRLRAESIDGDSILPLLNETPQSVILYEPGGRRQIHVDLKDIQERRYPIDRFDALAEGAAAVALCNINFSRALLGPAKDRGLLIASDVHAIADAGDEYNRDFMNAADVLFMSHERLPVPPEEWLDLLGGKYAARVMVVGMGADGAMMRVGGEGIERLPAVATRPIVNTIGAGDALFSSFLHHYAASGDPRAALRRAMVFASWKIGERGAAEGFLTDEELGEWERRIPAVG